MIEERAIVVRVCDGRIWVRAFGPESCPRCAQGRGCGGGVLARLVGRSRPQVRVEGSLQDLRCGDAVIVGVDEAALMRASLWVYLVPLAGMFAAGAFAHLVLQAHDLLVAGFGLAGLAGGFAAARVASRDAETSPRYRPVLLRRDAHAGAACARSAQA
ncbi:SoxR reducing system RseC family protein [Fontimonas sp. SYSU GA230001]|uniref:SoxR reducing system RseC family protein n=1 Tax=Fontimonas sp. SYSU GA230001 TaxID=3142450 RepID=UPI0032B31A5A